MSGSIDDHLADVKGIIRKPAQPTRRGQSPLAPGASQWPTASPTRPPKPLAARRGEGGKGDRGWGVLSLPRWGSRTKDLGIPPVLVHARSLAMLFLPVVFVLFSRGRGATRTPRGTPPTRGTPASLVMY